MRAGWIRRGLGWLSRGARRRPRIAGSTVFVVEGDPAACGPMGAVLRDEFGVQVLCDHTSSAAIDAVRREHPDVVLVDAGPAGTVDTALSQRLDAADDSTAVVALTAATWAHAERFLAEAEDDDSLERADLPVVLATVHGNLPPRRAPVRFL